MPDLRIKLVTNFARAECPHWANNGHWGARRRSYRRISVSGQNWTSSWPNA